MVWGYFLQILDKTVLGYGALFGLKEDTHLTGQQYSLASSGTAIAQLAWQPFSSYLIVRVPHRWLFPTLVLCWGAVQACMASVDSFGPLFACRFLLGLFEAGCFPLFSIIVSKWYRRSEHPIRIAAFYSTNGIANIVAAAISYGLSRIEEPALAPWRILFLMAGVMTVASAFPIWYYFADDPSTAWFLTEEERLQAVERLRANQDGAGSREFKLAHLLEVAVEVKSYLWIGMALCLNVCAMVANTFGPLILNGIGFDKYKTTLLNMPFGVVQIVTICACAYACQKLKLKSPICVALSAPVIAGVCVLYLVPRTDGNTGPLLLAYYLTAFVFSGNAPVASWIVGNTGGSTKKSVIMGLYNASSAAGSIIGPLLFSADDAPQYRKGLRSVLGITVAFAVLVIMQVWVLKFLNKRQERKRVANGKQAKIHDHSMEERYVAITVGNEEEGRVGSNAFKDLTDRQNDEFTYIY